MGLTDLAKRLAGGSGPNETETESRRVLSLGRDLLALAPRWRGGLEDQAFLAGRLDELEEALKNMDGRLTLGLLGGTGVGKSTLISALAGEPISVAGVIRPTTSLPVVYRHCSSPPPEGLEGREAIHEIEALRGLAIVDFPDFDSLEAAHRQVVSSYLRRLDLVLWVTDYHKYADRRLYETMRRAGLGAMAQAALLNKRDEILIRPDGAEAMRYIIQDFAGHLRDFGGWQGPAPWPISAAEALARPRDPGAGGLQPLRRLLDDLADDKYRRAVELGNLEAKTRDFPAALEAAAQPRMWLERLEALSRLKADYRPGVPLEADLALLSRQDFLYVNPRLEALKGQARGLLALFTDFWDFAASRFKGAAGAATAAPPPLAPAFAHHLAGWSREAEAVSGGQGALTEDEALKEGGEILQQALAANFTEPRISSRLLWLWPLVWAFLLIWAESGGNYAPSAVTSAALRSAAPWLILAALGDLVLSRFIWFRARRAYERAFGRALAEASAGLMKTAETRVLNPIEEGEKNLSQILDLTADLTRANDSQSTQRINS